MASLTRRLFLRGAAVVAPLAAIPAAAAVADSYVEENPILLALEEPLARAVWAYKEAVAFNAEAQKVARGLWKRAPEAITYQTKGWDIERDWNGRGYGDDVGVQSASTLQWEADYQRRWRKITPEREEKRRRTLEQLALAREYEANCAHALEVSQVKAAETLLTGTVNEIARVARLAHAEPAHTMVGIRFKARVLQAWNGVGRRDRMLVAWKLEGEDWGAGLAASLLEVLEA